MTKRKRQPTAEMMREQLRLAADEIIRLRDELYWHKGAAEAAWKLIDPPRESWWQRLLQWL